MQKAQLSVKIIVPLVFLSALPLIMLMFKPAPRLDIKRMPRRTVDQTPLEQPSGVLEIPSLAGLVSHVEFFGGTSGAASGEREFVITASPKSPWGYATILFKQPLNLWDNALILYAKKNAERTSVFLGFTDEMRRPTAPDERIEIKFEPDYKNVSIKARDISSLGIDKSRITSMTVFLQSEGAINQNPREIAVKELSLLPNRRP